MSLSPRGAVWPQAREGIGPSLWSASAKPVGSHRGRCGVSLGPEQSDHRGTPNPLHQAKEPQKKRKEIERKQSLIVRQHVNLSHSQGKDRNPPGRDLKVNSLGLESSGKVPRIAVHQQLVIPRKPASNYRSRRFHPPCNPYSFCCIPLSRSDDLVFFLASTLLVFLVSQNRHLAAVSWNLLHAAKRASLPWTR